MTEPWWTPLAGFAALAFMLAPVWIALRTIQVDRSDKVLNRHSFIYWWAFVLLSMFALGVLVSAYAPAYSRDPLLWLALLLLAGPIARRISWRARDAAQPRWLAYLAVLPGFSLALMPYLAVVPSRGRSPEKPKPSPAPSCTKMTRTLRRSPALPQNKGERPPLKPSAVDDVMEQVGEAAVAVDRLLTVVYNRRDEVWIDLDEAAKAIAGELDRGRGVDVEEALARIERAARPGLPLRRYYMEPLSEDVVKGGAPAALHLPHDHPLRLGETKGDLMRRAARDLKGWAGDIVEPSNVDTSDEIQFDNRSGSDTTERRDI